MNILAAGIAEGGASQCGDIARDFKIVGARPEAQLYGQIIGSLFGAPISCAFYRLYTSIYSIPGPLLQIPASYLEVNAAELIMGRGLPDRAATAAICVAGLFRVVTLIKMRFSDRWWQNLLPGGVPFAIGKPPLSAPLPARRTWPCAHISALRTKLF